MCSVEEGNTMFLVNIFNLNTMSLLQSFSGHQCGIFQVIPDIFHLHNGRVFLSWPKSHVPESASRCLLGPVSTPKPPSFMQDPALP